jgi:GNAT superfamily N-acetyltransferase
MEEPAALSQRPPLQEDEEFLFGLYADSRSAEMASWGWPPAQQESFLRMQFRARRESYAATHEGAVQSILLLGDVSVGSMIVWQSSAEIRLVDIGLLPEFRNRGLGALWLSRLIGQAAAIRIPLRLSVHRGNPAIHLYERLGFASTAAGPIYIEMEHKRVGCQ